ncbi:MAG: metallophosphoesterase [Gemmataceae bacterium]|nr:metallophosphoesterase [Gemmataceae bacterium]
MKRLSLAGCALLLMITAIAFSSNQKAFNAGGVQVEVENRNPWTHLRVNDDPGTFHFAVVSDRTGGHRARVFSQAIDQLNLVQPAFVVSVGDLIEGYTKDQARLNKEWKEFQGYVHKLKMPFFYVPGNHDLTNPTQVEEWKQRFGRRYYHFTYRDVLFLMVATDDEGEDQKSYGKISKEQAEYFAGVLKDNPNARWTIVCIHKPIWSMEKADQAGWIDVEKNLAGRNYTVFAGHVHRYQKFVRNGMNYYQLATTGGGSKLRGLEYGEFDHFAWITMTREGPVVANLLLDGILPENLQKPITEEEGVVVANRKAVHPTKAKVLLDGTPIPGATVSLESLDEKKMKYFRTSDGMVEADGAVVFSTYTAADGVPAGDYVATVSLRQPKFEPSGKAGPNVLPERYLDATKSGLRVQVKTGDNQFVLELVREAPPMKEPEKK